MSQDPTGSAGDSTEPEITALLRRLTEVEAALSAQAGAGQASAGGDRSSLRLLQTARNRLAANEAVRRQLLEDQAAILNALPAHVALVDAQGVIRAVNDAWRNFAGSHGPGPASCTVGINYLEACDKATGPGAEDSRAVAAGVRRVLAGESNHFEHVHVCHAPTETRWFRMVVAPLRHHSGAGAVIMHVDITDGRLAAEAVRESEERFRSTFDQATVGIAHISPEGYFIRVNDRLCSILGYTRDELTRLNFKELASLQESVKEEDARVRMLAGEVEQFTIEKPTLRKDGTRIWIRVGTTLLRAPDGTPKYFISIAEDVTERKLSDLRIQRLNRLYAVLSRIGETIVRTRDVQSLYQAACRIMVEEGHLSMAAVVGVVPGTRVVRALAAAGHHPDFLTADWVDLDDDDQREGTIGLALTTGRHDICNDLNGDPRMAPWRELIHANGFQSTASFPLNRDGEIVAALVLFSDETGYFQADEIELMVTVAKDLSFAIGAFGREQRRLEAEQALRASEASMAAAQRVGHFGSWEEEFVDGQPVRDGTSRVRWSDEMFRIAGFKPGTKPPQPGDFLTIVHPDDRQAVRAAFDAAVNSKTSYSLMHRIVRPDGDERTVQVTAQIYRDEATGRPLKIVGTTHDITDQRRAEARSRELGERLTSTLESMTEAFFTVDREWRFTYLNSEAERRLNRNRVELLGLSIWEAIPSLAGTDIEREYRRAMAQDAAVQFETYFEPMELWVEVRAYPSDQGLAVYFRDISRERKAREALHMSEERFRLLSRTTNDAIWDWDMLTDELWWNDGFESLSGYKVGDAAATITGWGEMIHPDDRLRVLDGLARSLDSGASQWAGEYRFRHRDGHYVYVLDRGHVMRNEAGNPVRMIGGVTDLTERRRMEEELRQTAARLQVSEAQYRLLFAGNPQPMWVHDPRTQRVLAVNAAALRHCGYTEAEFLSLHLSDLVASGEARDLLDSPALGSGPRSIQRRHRRKDGSIIDVQVTADDIRFAGQPARLVLASDITERLRHERQAARATQALEMLSRCNEALIRADSESMLLADVCRIAVEVGGFPMAWVGYALQDTGRSVVPQAWAGAEDGYLNAITFSWAEDRPDGQGPVGRAIRSGAPVVEPDLAAISQQPMLGWARERGFQGVVCLPLGHDGRQLGVLCLYLSESVAPEPGELRLLQEMADDLAFGILTLREREERRRTQEAVITMAQGVSAVTGSEFFHQLTRSLVKAVGAFGGFIARLDPPDQRKASTLSAVIRGQVAPNFQYELHNEDFGSPGSPVDWVIPRDAVRHYPNSRPLRQFGIQAYVGTKLMDPAGNPVGLIVVLFQEPLVQQEFVTSALRIFAARAAAELERLKADAKVREQAALLDKAQDAILVRDLEHRVTYWNKSAERLYGWTAAQALGRSVKEILYRDTAAFEAAMEKLLADGDWVGEIEQFDRDGKPLVIEGRWTLVRDDMGRPVSVLAINTDVTERKRLEQQFLRAQRMESIGTLAGGIAHDFNNVLSPILMAVSLLKKDEKDEERLELLDMLESSANRGADMVKQVLSFARGVEGRRIEVQVRHLIREVAKIANDTFLKTIDIRTVLPANLWPVLGDPTQLHQVLINLCVNARDAMPEGGTLLLSAENIVLDEQVVRLNGEARTGPYVRVHIQDSGSGMSREVMDKIFEPFFTTKDQGKGTGLGLPTSLAIVRSHGGVIHVYSEPGTGSTFHVYLPALVDPAAVSGDLAAATANLPTGNGELVLVVDDEPAIREVTSQTLETFGYQVLTATDGADGLAIYTTRRQDVALVLTDMMMPVMDGPTLIRTIRETGATVPIIATSGVNASNMVDQAMQAGVQSFLGKPYTAEALLTTVKKVLGS